MVKKSKKTKSSNYVTRASLWLLKAPFRLVWWILKGFYNSFKFTIKKSARAIKLHQNPIYTSQAKFDSFEVNKVINGDFQSTEKRLEKDSIIALIFGKRGSGKSALGFKLLENIHCLTKRECYALSMEQSLIPKWIHPTENVESVPDNSLILVDEGAISFGSRNSMTAKNKELSNLLAIARHKNLTLIFVTQNTGMIDKNILKLVDMLFVKEGSLLQEEMERTEIKKFYEKAKKAFSHVKENKISYAYVIDNDFEGVISFSLPSFWSNNLSKNRSKEN
jgi:hypothetical protein